MIVQILNRPKKYSACASGFSKLLKHINYLHFQTRFYTGNWGKNKFQILSDCFTKHYYVLSILFCMFSIQSVQAQDNNYPFLNLTMGKLGVFDPDKKNNRYGMEYRGTPITKWALIPSYGISWSTEKSKYLYTELKHDWLFKKHWVFTTSLGVGFFDNSNNIDLGYPIEFRSGFELTFKFENGYRLGFNAYHLSNSRLSSKNPGTESLSISLLIPLHSLQK